MVILNHFIIQSNTGWVHCLRLPVELPGNHERKHIGNWMKEVSVHNTIPVHAPSDLKTSHRPHFPEILPLLKRNTETILTNKPLTNT